ncbi:hypothetical protein HYX14_01460 [Candidatus Woesearchaeota archaeon]|nr:hypothetical protein [Candidatus Woesearchaeota archaeon]
MADIKHKKLHHEHQEFFREFGELLESELPPLKKLQQIIRLQEKKKSPLRQPKIHQHRCKPEVDIFEKLKALGDAVPPAELSFAEKALEELRFLARKKAK